MTDQAREGLLSPFLRYQRIMAVRPLLVGSVLDIGCGSGSLADCVDPAAYIGVDRDLDSTERARASFPQHTFVNDLSQVNRRFDTVAALAVIEHVIDPADFLRSARDYMADRGAIVLTTPHPAVDWVHEFGARLGLFSSHASEEHEVLLDRTLLERSAADAGLRVQQYRRFLLGANQLAVLKSL